MGFTRSQATRIHQQKLNFNLTDLANHGINPSPRSSAWIREVWLTENHGHLSGESMFSAIQKYKNNNEATRIELEVYDGGNFAIVLVWRWLCDANHGVKKEERQQLIQVMKQLVYAKSSVDFENYWLQYCKSSVSQQNDKYTSLKLQRKYRN
ncbi:hypothetical protein Pcinc_017881 [Petrolisthes cinctipes]|uniref:Uncharacterized protein n=1 Tax=Petrolisthes cinctipes TaxID=88211 RepID=A0AAE1FH86_PETCI|nr:hypothetical protein Pcinc_020784 [Petrolisthes cinctipes]KAK3877402.1 hypothetical protein Pcinc_017881 [Petrolisthes cinctipes]